MLTSSMFGIVLGYGLSNRIQRITTGTSQVASPLHRWYMSSTYNVSPEPTRLPSPFIGISSIHYLRNVRAHQSSPQPTVVLQGHFTGQLEPRQGHIKRERHVTDPPVHTRRVINQLHTKHSVRSVTSPPNRHVERALLRCIDLIEVLDDREVHVLVLVNRVTAQIHNRVITTARPLRTPGARRHIRVSVTEQGHHTVIRRIIKAQPVPMSSDPQHGSTRVAVGNIRINKVGLYHHVPLPDGITISIPAPADQTTRP